MYGSGFMIAAVVARCLVPIGLSDARYTKDAYYGRRNRRRGKRPTKRPHVTQDKWYYKYSRKHERLREQQLAKQKKPATPAPARSPTPATPVPYAPPTTVTPSPFPARI